MFFSFVFFLSFIFILCFQIFQKGIHLPRFQIWKHGIVLGTLLSLSFIFFISGLRFTSSGSVAFYTSMSVIWTPILMGVFFKKIPNYLEILSVVLSLFAIAVSVDFSFVLFNKGDFLALTGAIFFSLYIIKLDQAPNNEAVSLTTIQFLISSIVFLLLFLGEDWSDDSSFWSNYDVVTLIIASLGCTVVPFILQVKYQSNLSPTVVSVIFLTEPFFTSLFSSFIYSELITERLVLGLCLLFLANFFILYGDIFLKKKEGSL